jgi:hypothetical protein
MVRGLDERAQMFPLCSYGVKRAQTPFPSPWTVKKLNEDCFTVQDATGVSVAFIYSRDDLHRQRWGDYNKHLTSDEARRVAATIAKIPELLGKRT